MRVIVFGGRHYANRIRFVEVMFELCSSASVIIHGGATGADMMADKWATENRILVLRFPPKPKLFFGNMTVALLGRNQEMIDVGRPDFGIAFPGGNGTADMMRRMRIDEIPLVEVRR